MSKNNIKLNHESRRMYNVTNQTRFKTSIIRSNLCDYSDAYMHVKGPTTFQNTGTAVAPNNIN